MVRGWASSMVEASVTQAVSGQLQRGRTKKVAEEVGLGYVVASAAAAVVAAVAYAEAAQRHRTLPDQAGSSVAVVAGRTQVGKVPDRSGGGRQTHD